MTILRRRSDMRCVLGIDQSYSGFAVCFYRPDGSHSMLRRAFLPTKHGSGVDRLADIGSWLTLTLEATCGNSVRIEHVCMEGYARNRRNGREEAGELGAVVKLALRTCTKLRSPACYPTVVAPPALKKFVCGAGRSEKSDMKLHVYKKWGQEFKTDDEADSYGLARIAAAIQWRENLLGYQQDVLNNLRYHTERQG